MNNNTEFRALYARLDDLCERADKGEVGISDFLSPREAHFARAYLDARRAAFVLFGGYEGAKRTRIYILPDYIDVSEGIEALADFGFGFELCAVKITPSGFRSLTHRDYLGSVLSLGIERAVIGDILVYEDGSGVIFCTESMQEFLLTELKKIANDKVKTSAVALHEVVLPERRFAQINDTVASARLDCVVGALCSLSREKAKELVTSRLVELDFECEERPDREISEGALVSVRGYGRYKIVALSDKTRKGRYRLGAEKFL